VIWSLRIECTKFGGEAPKKREGTCGAPIFFIPQSVLGHLLQEGFTIKEISSISSVSESMVYWRMRQYGLSKFKFTDISDKDLDAESENVTVEFSLLWRKLYQANSLSKRRKGAEDENERQHRYG